MSKVEDIKANLNKKAEAKKESIRRDWQEFSDHPLLYSALVVSGVLSSLAGAAVGLGLQVTDGNMLYHGDFPHIFFAVLYAALFPYFFEYGLANWLNKYLEREPENKVQNYTAAVMVVITFIGTAVTAFSAMDVLVTSLGFFNAFQEIPPVVQKWVAFALPGMLMLNIAAGEFYRQFSTAAVLQREISMELREKKIEADNEVRIAKMEAEKNVAIHAAQEYARRATQDTPKIGQQKGGAMWDGDKTRHMPVPMTTNAQEVERVQEREQRETRPTQAGKPND